MTYRDKNEFTETINISSNIRDNKNTIIGKFDLKDILFILIAGVVGIGVLSILFINGLSIISDMYITPIITTSSTAIAVINLLYFKKLLVFISFKTLNIDIL